MPKDLILRAPISRRKQYEATLTPAPINLLTVHKNGGNPTGNDYINGSDIKHQILATERQHEIEQKDAKQMKTIFLLSALLLFLNFERAEANFKIQITGKVLDENGKPLILAHAHVGSFKHRKPSSHYQVGKDGSFKILLDQGSLYKLQFTGVGHNMFEMPFNAIRENKDANIIVRLQPYQYYDSIETVKLLCSLNDFRKPFFMKRNGKIFQFDTILEYPVDTFSYQILGIESTASHHSINGTQSDYYSYDNDGDYRSIVNIPGNEIHINFNPYELPHGLCDFSISASPMSTKRIALAYQKVRSMRNRYSVWQEVNPTKDYEEFNNTFPSEVENLISIENENFAKQILLVAYLEFCLPQIYGKQKLAKDEIINNLLQMVSPTSSVWNLFVPYLPAVIPGICKNSSTSLQYVDRLIKHQSDSTTCIEILNNIIQYQAFANDSTLKIKYLNMLKSLYPNNPTTINAIKSYSGE